MPAVCRPIGEAEEPHAFRSTTEISSPQSICGLHSSREVGRKGPKCFTPDPRNLVPGTYQRCQHCPEHADDCLRKGKDGLRPASLMFALIGMTGSRRAAPIAQFCARHGSCCHASISMQNEHLFV